MHSYRRIVGCVVFYVVTKQCLLPEVLSSIILSHLIILFLDTFSEYSVSFMFI
jgi:hypothetical protein